MRLTLRTLLSYLDDTLDASQTRLIGQKVAESPAAQELITRIKEVVRRRRLSTPPSTGPDAKLDPNAIAEYIDNILSPEMVTQLEETCLGSDVYLAEVAACHQMLTVLQSEPVLVPPTAKRRMYSLFKGREAIPHRRAPAAAAATVPSRTGDDAEDDTLLLGMSFLRHDSWFRRIAPLAGAVLLVIGMIVAIWFALPATTPRPAPELRITLDLPPEAKNGATAKTEEGPKKDTPKPEPSIDPKPEPKPAPEPRPETRPEPEPRPEPRPPDAPAAERHEIGQYLAGPADVPSILLQRRGERPNWQRARPGPVFTQDTLLSLPGFRSEVKLRRGVQLSLWGNMPDHSRGFTMESEVVIGDSAEFDLDVTLERGRIAMVNQKVQAAAKVRIRFQKNESWELTLLQPGTEVAMELWGAYPPGIAFSKDVGGEEPMAVVGLFVTKGKATLKVRYDTNLMSEAPGKNLYFWDNIGPATRAPTAVPADKMPSWTKPEAPRPPKELLQALAYFDKNLGPNASIDDVLDVALKVKDKQSLVRVVAVFSLAALDELPRLVDALGNSEFRDERVAAISALRHWCAIRPENDRRLYAVLESKYRAEPAEIVMNLLHTYGDAQRGDPLTYEILIAYLKHEKIAIRELAYSHLASLVPDAKITYDPAGAPDHRDAAYQRWKSLIPDGKLPPPPKPPVR